MKIKSLLIVLFFSFQLHSAFAADSKTGSVNSVKVSKEDMLKGLEALKSQGKISEEDYQKAKKSLSGLNEAQVNALNEKAAEVIQRDPEQVQEMLNAKKIEEKMGVTPKK